MLSYRTFSVLVVMMFLYLEVQPVRGENTVTFESIWYGNVYARACLDVPEAGVTCGWNVQFFFDPVVTALTVYNTRQIAHDSHYFVVKDVTYNQDLSFVHQLCLPFTGSNPSITYPQNPNVTAKFVCTCNAASTEDCSSRTYTFDTRTSTTATPPATTIAPTTTNMATTTTTPERTTTMATTTTTPERTTTIFDIISSTDIINRPTIVETNDDPGTGPSTSRDREHQYRIWKKHHVSDNNNFKYNTVGSVTDCALWCSHYTNCTGFTIYNTHCWAVINEEMRSNRYFENCHSWIRA